MWNKETVLPSTTLTLCQPWQLPANFFGVSGNIYFHAKKKTLNIYKI